MGKMATSPLPSRGSPPLQSGGTKSEGAHLWARWLPHPCRLGDPHRFRAGGQNQKGPLVGKMATSPLPSRGSPPLESGGTKSHGAHLWARWLCPPCRLGDPHRFRAGGQNHKGPTCGQNGYVTPALSGIPTASEWGDKIRRAHLWAKWLPHPCRLGDPHRFRTGGQNQKGPTCGQGGDVPPALSGIPTASERGDKIRRGPLVGKMATSPLPSRGSPPLQSGGTKSEGAHLRARWPRHPCCLGDPHRFRAGGQNRKWPTSGQKCYIVVV